MAKTIKIFIFLAFSFAFIIKPQKIAQSNCGGYDPDYYATYTFFKPLSFQELGHFRYYTWEDDETVDDNIAEWKTYF